MGNSFLFALYIHHCGRFVNLEKNPVYVGGESEGKFHLDPDRFGYFDLEEIVHELGYISWDKLWFQIPKSQSFRVVQDDKNVMAMLSCLEAQTRVLHVYVDGGIVFTDDMENAKKKDEGETVCDGESQNATKIAEGGSVCDGESKKGTKKAEVESRKGSKRAVDESKKASKKAVGESRKGSKKAVDESKKASKKAVGESKIGEGGVEKDFVRDDGVNQIFEGDNAWEGEYDSNVEEEELFDNVVTGEDGLVDGDGQDTDYYPMDGESSDDELADDELVSDDEEYVQARQKVKAKRSIFDLVDEEPEKGMGFAAVYEHEHVESDYQSSEGEICSDSTDEELEGKRSNKFKSSYDPRIKPKKLKLQLGMRFADGFKCREALRDNAIAKGRYIKFGKVSKTSCRATCRTPCPWTVFASLVQANDTFMIKTYYPTHNCTRKNNNKLVSSRWIARQYQNVFRINPNMPINLLAEDIRTRYKTVVGRDRLYRARQIAQEMMRGSVEDHYALLRRYVAVLMRVDREGTYTLLLGDGAVFKGLYIGHSALRHGFKKSCRPIIGLDGCFLKTYLGGILLTAVGKDGNNQMFPIAWAVVEVENEECWNWFLQILLNDLAITDGNGWTFISDQQKGLMNAVSKLAPFAEHRNCARHVYMNWKKQHKGTGLKNIFWSIAISTYVQEYNINLEKLKAENPAAHDDFVSRDVTRFCKCFISMQPLSDMIDNNIAETFNGYILAARGMHIIHMCEQIRRDLMVRQVEKLKMMAMVSDRVCPVVMKDLEKTRKKSIRAYVFPNMDNKYEVSLKGRGFVVDMNARTCTCRKWDLTGIPCVHACAAIHFEGEEPHTYVHDYYTVERYLEAYKYAIEPLVSEEMWPVAEGYTIKPPLIRKLPGRPKKVRRRDPEEDPKNPHKLRRFGLVMTCQNCRQKGHNSKTCTNEKTPAQPKGKRGRPRIHPIQPPRPNKKENEQEASSSNAKTQQIAKRRGRKPFVMPGRTRPLNQTSSNASKNNLTGDKVGPSTQESRNAAPGN